MFSCIVRQKMHNVYRILFVRFHVAQKDTVTDHSAYGVSIIYIYSILIKPSFIGFDFTPGPIVEVSVTLLRY